MEHYICRTVTENPGYIQAQFRVPQNTEIVAGEVFNAEELYNNTYGNYTVYLPTLMQDINDEPAIIINNSFETLDDGRRPEGQPDYTQYVYKAGEVITGVRLVPGIKFELGTDGLDNVEDLLAEDPEKIIGTWLYPTVNSSSLIWTNDFDDIDTKVYLYIENIKYFRLGGKFGSQYAYTLIVRVKHQKVEDSMLKLTADIEEGLVAPLEAKTVVATLSTTGGTEPYTYELLNSIEDNDLFEISNQYIRNKAPISQDRTYNVRVKVTDSEGMDTAKTFSILVDSPSLDSLDLTMTDDIRELEKDTQPGGLIATMQAVGGTAPYIYSISGKDANRFVVDLMSLKVGQTPLVEGDYDIIITATDNKGKTLDHSLTVHVNEPYPDIDSVTIKPDQGLKIPLAAHTSVGDIQVIGGTAPYTITLPSNINDNSLFMIEDSIKTLNEINTPGNRTVTVHVVDKHGKTKNATGIIVIEDADEIENVKATVPNNLAEGEKNVSPNATVVTLITTGGAQPIDYSIGGTDASYFVVAENSIKVGKNALTAKTYSIDVTATDTNNKTKTISVSIPVAEPYPEIERVSVTPISGLKVTVAKDTVVANLSSTGGTAPITYSLKAGLSNNDKFSIKGNTVVAKDDITTSGSYAVTVTATDTNNKTKNSIQTAFIIAAE